MDVFKPVNPVASTRAVQLVMAVCALLTGLVASLLAAEQPFLLVAALLMFAVALATLVQPDTITLGFFLVLLTNSATIAVRFHGMPFIVGAAFPIMLVISAGYYVVIRRQPIVLTMNLFLLIGLLLVQCLGTLFARNIGTAFDNLQTFAIEAVLIYFLILNAVRLPRTLRWVINIFLISAIILGAVPIYQQITGQFENNFGGYGQIPGEDFETGQSLLGATTQPRLAGAIGEKNRFAQFMLMFGMIAVTQITGAKTRSERLLALVATGISFTAATLPFSRGAAVGLVLTIVIAVALSIISFRQLIAVVAAAAITLFAFPQYSSRLLSLNTLENYSAGNLTSSESIDGAALGRTTTMLASLLVFVDHPLIGVGPGQYRYYAQDVGNELGIRRLDEDRQAHNLALDIAANNGIFGLLLTAGIVITTMRGLHKVKNRWKTERRDLASIATGFYLAILTYLTTGIFLHHAYLRYFWTFMAVAGVVILISQKLEASSAPEASPPASRDAAQV